ncbi:hypothetical protein [Natronohydrobacter thiooxidans]|uniref:hypothetical protein n=1 Tax=Natronohydrobacter thiooxidans TaxID=87172 RepID=UPI0008FF46FC|nr:hypothetical protein [Natronohydrobacter thiooxidans]
MVLNRLAAFATVLAALTLAAPGEARADHREVYAESCAVFYYQMTRSTRAPEIIADFQQINEQNRWLTLIQSFGLDQDNTVAAAIYGVGSTAAELLVQDKLDSEDPSSGDRVTAVSALAECDRLYGFTPVVALTNQVSDFDCAVAYWLLGAFEVGHRQTALERSEFAGGLYHIDNPLEEAAAIGQQVMTAGQARGQRIQEGQESVDGLRSDLAACEAKYGFGQTVGQ